MTVTASVAIGDIQKRGRETQTLVLIVLVLAVLGLVGEIVVSPIVHMARGADARALLTGLRDNLVEALPILILLCGLWSAQKVFGRVAEGEVFTAANAAGVGEIGSAMGWCGLAEVVIVPSIKAWIARSGPFDLHLVGWAMVLAALGGAVVLFGRIWALAAEIKADSDQIV